MKIALRAVLAVLIAVGFAPWAAGQMGMGRPPSIAGVFNPLVGSGASYEMTRKNGEKASFDMYVVDKEAGGYWIEYAMEVPQMHGTIYSKMLFLRQADDIIIQRSIFQMPGRPPVDASSMMAMRSMQNDKQKADFRANAENLGSESVTTPAGTFSCQHWRSKKDGTEYWISDKVTPWQLVKTSGKDQNSLVLVRLISNAKSHITGTPVSMQEMMKGMGQQER